MTTSGHDLRGAGWHYLTAVMSTSAGTVKLYLDGAVVGTGVWSAGSTVTGLTIGKRVNGGGGNRYIRSVIDDFRLYTRALSQAEIQTDMNTPVSAPSGDTVPPTVSMTAPASGSTVSGTVTVSANASDNVGVAGVQFLLDGAALGSEDTTAPYGYSWNTASIANGSHTLAARARDAANNRKDSSTVTITVSNANSPDRVGQWSARTNWPLVAVHMSLLPNGKVLMWDGWEDSVVQYLWDPATQTFRSTSMSSAVFCSSHTNLADGRVLVPGGHQEGATLGLPEYGIKDTNLYNPATDTWFRAADMEYARWYPSVLSLADGRVAVISGQSTPGAWVDEPQVYDPVENAWSDITVSTSNMRSDYPPAFLLPNGLIGVLSSYPGEYFLFDADKPSWNLSGQISVGRGTALAYRPGKVLACGGGTQQQPSSKNAAVIDFTQTPPTWRTVAPMAFGRYQHNLVSLPDGTVFVVGGATTADQEATVGVLTPELWNPATETWASLAPMRDPRMYHSTALLMSDARVLVAGGGRLGSVPSYPTAEIYSPAYLFKGSRPVITQAPSVWSLGTSVVVQTPDAASVSSVVLIRLGSVTHTLDMAQRYVDLAFTRQTNSLLVQVPAALTQVPQGYYMLFIVNQSGVPSFAPTVRVLAPVRDMTSGMTLTAAQASVVGPGWSTSGNDLYASVADRWLEFNVNAGSGGTFQLAVTASNQSTPAAPNLPPNYSYQMAVHQDGVIVGTISIPGSTTQYLTGTGTFSFAPGVQTIRLTWRNDVFSAGNYDSNIRIRQVAFTPQGADTVPPVITGVTVSSITQTGVQVAWTTDEPAMSQVEYGLTGGYGSLTPVDAVRVTAHDLSLSSLSAGKTYHYRVRSKDAANNEGVSADAVFTTAAAGTPGFALSFDGVDDWFEIAPPPNLPSGEVTVSWWTNVPVSGFNDWSDWLVLQMGTGGEYVAEIDGNGNPALYAVGTVPGASSINATGSDLRGAGWHHLAAVMSGTAGTVTLYKDGAVAASGLWSVSGNFTGIMIGNRLNDDGGNRHIAAAIDEVRLYGRALTASQIAAQYNTGQGAYGQAGESGLISGWHLDESGGTAAADYSGSARTGTLRNGPTWVAGLVALPPGDTVAPTITGVAAGSITQTSAVVAWTTNEPATSQVDYGPTSNLGSSTSLDTTLVTSHSVTLYGLSSGTTHTYQVRSKDNADNEAISAKATFKTADAPVATPQISPNGGTFSSPVTMTLTTATSGASIRYTTNGSNPASTSTLYTAPLTLNASATVKAKAFKTGLPDSAIASASFTITQSLVRTALQTSAASSGWTTSGTERYAFSANEWLEYQVDFGAGGNWTLGLTATNQNSGAAPGLPAGYAYTIDVKVDGVSKGSFDVPGSTTTYQTGSKVIAMSSGVHTVRFTWTNDAYLAGQYDANIRVRQVSFGN